MTEEETQNIQEQQVSDSDLLETYKFFSNPVTANITIYNGMKLILEKITKIEEKLAIIEGKANEH